MVLPGTEIHIIVFIILLFEIAIFFFQVVYFLSRPNDQNRLWYLILLTMIIYYNIVSGFLPDKNIPISIQIQNCIAYSGGLLMSMYFPFYFYKTFNLKKLKFYAYGGSVLFLLLPFIMFFLIPYYLTSNLDLSRQLVVIVPFFYSFSFIIALTRAFVNRGWEKYNKEEIIGVYMGLIFWISLPVIVFFDGKQLLENSFANAGLLVMTILYIHKAIQEARREYQNLLDSERSLQQMNKDLVEKVKERTFELEQVNEHQKNTFVNLAHEMKTPLMLLTNYIDDYAHKNKIEEEFQLIEKSVNKLSRDIVNFFDLGRIEKGIEIYKHNQISDLSTILSDSIKMFQPLAAKKSIKLTPYIEKGVFIKADSQALYRIIYNLIENAIRYTPSEGNIEIFLNKSGNKIQFIVSDNGLGIAPEFHQHLFEPYYQIRSEKNNNQGVGVGLSIVKKIVDSLNGTIKVISSVVNPSGTTMSIYLPEHILVEGEETTYTNDKYVGLVSDELIAHDYIHSNDRPFILLVEDNIELLNYIADKLKEKYNIYIAVNASEAIKKLEIVDQLDIIVSDLMMDQGDGFDLFESIIYRRKFDHIPFIFITASIEQKDKIKALNLGAIDFIQKPFQIQELIGKIDSILQNIEKNKIALIESAYQALRKGKSTKTENNIEASCAKYNLTTREISIVKEIAKGKTYKDIADILSISDKTVAKHIQNIFEKVSVTRQAELLSKLGIDNH